MRISSLFRAGVLAATLMGCSSGIAATPQVRDGSHDFDFLYHHFLVHNRRLKPPLDSSHDWVKYDSTDEARPLPGGLGDEDFFRSNYPKPGFLGLTLRLYDPATGLWRLYFIDNASSHGDAGIPNVGRWRGNVGIFDERMMYHGKPAIDRYTWTRLDGRGSTKTAPHFEESLSLDHGKTWKIIYVADVIRIPAGSIAR